MADFILTYTKKKFYPIEPNKEDIDINDIAHALSLMTRANGHFECFFSVAQHCINCCNEAEARGYSKRVQLGCLLHDASESYLSDLTRPVKKNLPQYYAIEQQLQKLIYEQFGLLALSEEEMTQIGEIDDAMLYYEFSALMGVEIFDTIPAKKSEPDFEQREFNLVEKEYIGLFNKLTRTEVTRYSCVGIDACKGKWVAVCITEAGFEVDKFDTIEEIIKRYPKCDRYLIDIPIGLPESLSDLRPEGLVRKALGKKGSSIFGVPCRQAVYEIDKSMAKDKNIAVLGKSLSEQSLGISKAIRQVDEFLQLSPDWKNKLLESHPEFCFSKLNRNNPILADKKAEEGQRLRLEVLERYYPKAREIVQKFLIQVPNRKKIDDVIDALCLAVMGKQLMENGSRTIPEKPMQDRTGILMQMVYAE